MTSEEVARLLRDQLTNTGVWYSLSNSVSFEIEMPDGTKAEITVEVK